MEKADSIQQQCSEMAAILGLDEAVSEQVLQAAMIDTTYAHHLLVCKDKPEYLAYLLQHPPALESSNDTGPIGTAVLLTRAADSLMRWVKTGFSRVSDETYKKRLSACDDCPHLVLPPEKRRSLYKIAGAQENERTVCRRCGCVVKIKAYRTSDTCPDVDPLHPGFNRWGDPLK